MVLFLHITSRVEGEPHPDLMSEKGGLGWPFVSYLSETGEVMAQQSYSKMEVAGFEETLADDVQAYSVLAKKAASGDVQAQAEFFMMRFELGTLSPAELEAALGKQGFLSDKQVVRVRLKLLEVETQSILKGIDYNAPETFGPYAAKLLALQKRVGLPEGAAGINPWLVVLEDAYTRKDAPVFEMAFTALKAAGMRNDRFVQQRQKQLDEIKK